MLWCNYIHRYVFWECFHKDSIQHGLYVCMYILFITVHHTKINVLTLWHCCFGRESITRSCRIHGNSVYIPDTAHDHSVYLHHIGYYNYTSVSTKIWQIVCLSHMEHYNDVRLSYIQYDNFVYLSNTGHYKSVNLGVNSFLSECTISSAWFIC